MPLQVPPAVNYPSPLVAVPSIVDFHPREGNKQISCEILWLAMGGAGNCVGFNFANNATLEFSQIVALKVDNSLCGMDVQFCFPDTVDTVTIPAYSPTIVVPIFSHATAFYVVATGREDQDVTRFQILNYLPPPIAIPTTQTQYQTAVSYLTIGNAVLSKQIVPLGVSGTLEFLQLAYTMPAPPAAASTGLIQVQGGGGAYLINSMALTAGTTTTTPGQIILDLKDLRWRFINGVTLFWNTPTGGWSNGGILNITAGYRTP